MGRSRLLYGEWLRRQRRRQDGRDQLRGAYEVFDSIGADAFAERARIELRATGGYAGKRTVDTGELLSAQEGLVARLAGGGASNSEIAAQLFISPATVAYHLRKVFVKLGISSRTQLVGVLREQQVVPCDCAGGAKRVPGAEHADERNQDGNRDPRSDR